MKKLMLLVLACAGLSSIACAQSEAQARSEVEAFFYKTTELQFYNLMLPILITKDQFKVIMPAIEHSRERVRLTYKKELGQIHAVEDDVDHALIAAKDKDEVPTSVLEAKLDKVKGDILVNRLIMAQLNENDVYDVIMKTLSAGQQKAMANSLSPKLIDPNLKPDKMTQEDKLRLFIRDVLLSPDFYEDLVKMSIKG